MVAQDVGGFVNKSVVAQIEDGGDQGQEGVDRRGGGPHGRPLHHFKAPDGATYVLYIYLGWDLIEPAAGLEF